jgi:hypothetical protein
MDYAPEEDFERRMSRVHKVWAIAHAVTVITSEVSWIITNSELNLNPVLSQHSWRVDKAEKELMLKGLRCCGCMAIRCCDVHHMLARRETRQGRSWAMLESLDTRSSLAAGCSSWR